MEAMWLEAKDAVMQTSDLPVKGDTYLGSGEKHPEPLEKGILRARNNTSTFRDGTVRFDMVDITMTHFRPGRDRHHRPGCGETRIHHRRQRRSVTRDDQVIEIYPQDIVVPWSCVDSLLNVCRFVDDELEHIYGMDRIYECQKPNDLIGQPWVWLPTSGRCCAVIGFLTSRTLRTPYFHAAKRRNCDSAIDCIMMLGDGLINFSRLFLPRTRGGRMDSPLTLTTGSSPTRWTRRHSTWRPTWSLPRIVLRSDRGRSVQPTESQGGSQHGVTIVEDLLGTDAALRVWDTRTARYRAMPVRVTIPTTRWNR